MKTKLLLVLAGLLMASSAFAVTRGSTEIRCDSQDDKFRRCFIDHGSITDARLVDQRSNAECREGRSWGYDEDSVWVDRGCRGTFRVYYDNGGHGGGEISREIRCRSSGGNYNECSVNFRVESVRLLEQHSNATCRADRTFGAGRDYVWVDRGCDGTFRVNGY